MLKVLSAPAIQAGCSAFVNERRGPKALVIWRPTGVANETRAIAVDTVAVEVIEQSAPGVITVTEVEETEVRQAS